MNVYERYIAGLSERTGIGIRLYERLPESLDPQIFRIIEKNSATGWYDSASESVCLFKRNLPSEESSIDANVAFLYLREKGISGLLGGHAESFHKDVVSEFCKIARPLDLRSWERKDLSEGFIYDLSPDDMDSWMRIAGKVSAYTGFRPDRRFARALANGCKAYQANVYRKAKMNADHKAVDSFVKSQLSGGGECVGASLGRAGDAFLRVGYPDAELYIRSGRVRDFLVENALLGQDIPLTGLIQNPVAIIAGNASKKDGKEALNILVTDHYVKGEGFLSFMLDSPNDVLAGYGEGKSLIFLRGAKFMSEYALMSALGSDEGRNIRYLSPGAHGGYAVSDMLSRMEGRSFGELGKKIGNGITPDFSPLSESRRLMNVANIVNNFRNSMQSNKRKEIFGKFLFEESLERRAGLQREMEEMRKPASRQMPVPEDRPKKIKDPKRIYYDGKDFSAGIIKKLQDRRVGNAFDVMTYGKERFRSDFGPKAFRQAVEFLDRNNLSFMHHTVVKRIDESVLTGLDSDGYVGLLNRDLHNAFSSVDEDKLSRDVCMPRRIDGTYFRGSECYCMLAKSYSLARWRECNVFISRPEAEALDINILSGAVPTYVREKGSMIPYYNLSETSFAVDNAESFKELKEYSLSTSAPIDPYAKAYMYSFLNCKAPSADNVDIYRTDLIDAAFERHFSRGSSLTNTGGVRERMTGVSARLAEAYMQGKADGIRLMDDRKEVGTSVIEEERVKPRKPGKRPRI